MAFTDFPTPHGVAGTRGFETPGVGFTGQPRDCPGPLERGPAPLFIPAAAVPAPVLEPAVVPAPPAVSPPEAEMPLVPEETAFSLRQWSEALIRPVPDVENRAVDSASPVPAQARAAAVSLAALADQLSARFVHDETPPPGAEDLLEAPESALPPAALTPPSGPAPEPLLSETLPLDPAPELTPAPPRLTASPAGIRAAAGLLSNPPRSVPARHQGDVFFLDHPAAAAPSVAGSLLEADDFPGLLLDTEKEEPDALTRPQDIPQEPIADGWASLLPDKSSRGLAEPESAIDAGHVEKDLPAFQPAPVAALPPPLPAFVSSAPAEDAAAETRGIGLILGGVGLLIAGILLACRLPLLWLDHTASTGWDQHVLESSMIFHAGGALLAMVAGVGSLLQKRGAIHLTLAAGWLAVFTSALVIGIAGFLLGSDADWNLDKGGTVALLASLLLPLGYLLSYEKLSHGFTDPDREGNDPAPPRSVPLLMVMLSALTVFSGAVSLLLFSPAAPLPDGSLLTGPAAQAVWTAIAILSGLSAVAAWFRHRTAWWLLLVSVLGVIGTLSVSALAGIPAWSTFLHALGRPAGAVPPGLLWTPALGLAPLILLLVLAMARRAFVPPPSSP
jgi:hypothetical protein